MRLHDGSEPLFEELRGFGVRLPAGHADILGHAGFGVADLISGRARGEPALVDGCGDGLAEGVRDDPVQLKRGPHAPPLALAAAAQGRSRGAAGR